MFAPQVEGVQVDIALQWTSDAFSDTLVGFVNSIKTVDGGTHMDGLKVVPTSFRCFLFCLSDPVDLHLPSFVLLYLHYLANFNKRLVTLFVSFLICFHT